MHQHPTSSSPSASKLPAWRILPHILGNASKKVWHALILRDHWQGEFCVALFGSAGWAIISWMAPDGEGFDRPAYDVLRKMLPEHAWQVLFMLSAVAQLVGLRYDNSWTRVVGATCTLVLMLVCFTGVMIATPWTIGLCTYLACISIEVCAIIYLTARIIRFSEVPTWRLTGKV